MKEQTKNYAEEVLTLLFYGLDLLMFPTLKNWDQSYEGWLHRNGLLRRMHYLEKQKLLLREGKKSAWVYRLTGAGRRLIQGGEDPEARWNRDWDGWWRQIIFDLPVERQKERWRLIRWLKQHGFGYLQDSVWISPDPVVEIADAVKGFCQDAEAFTILESRCAPGFGNLALVKGAWQFDKINAAFQRHNRFASNALNRVRRERLHPSDLFLILRQERRLWLEAYRPDPLLPSCLLPSNYEGRQAHETRCELLAAVSRQVNVESKDQP